MPENKISQISKQFALQWLSEEIINHRGSGALLHFDDVFINNVFDVKIFDAHIVSALF